jgi:integrase
MSPHKVSKAWKRVCKALKLQGVSFHALRYTHAGALIAAKEDIVKIGRRLGHSSPTVTLSIYSHFSSKTTAPRHWPSAGFWGKSGTSGGISDIYAWILTK